jgi:hypothetical protein
VSESVYEKAIFTDRLRLIIIFRNNYLLHLVNVDTIMLRTEELKKVLLGTVVASAESVK